MGKFSLSKLAKHTVGIQVDKVRKITAFSKEKKAKSPMSIKDLNYCLLLLILARIYRTCRSVAR